jgi:hypothetical protein
MPTPFSAWVWVDLSPHMAVANTSWLVAKPAPVAGTIKSCWIGINTVLTTGGGTLAVAKAGANILSSATYNLGAAATPDLVAATPELATLTTAATTLKVAAGDLLSATWTLTTAAITNAAACLIAIEPDTW